MTRKFRGHLRNHHAQSSQYGSPYGGSYHGQGQHNQYGSPEWDVTQFQLRPQLWLSRYHVVHYVASSVEFFLEWEGDFDMSGFKAQVEDHGYHKGVVFDCEYPVNVLKLIWS